MSNPSYEASEMSEERSGVAEERGGLSEERAGLSEEQAPLSEEQSLANAEQRVYDEQESNARATGDGGPRDDEQANELAAEASREHVNEAFE